MITVVGLGAEAGDLTEKGKAAILSAKRVLVRTAHARSYQSVVALGVEHETLDEIYERSRKYDTLNEKLAKAVAASGDGTVYCVDGAASEDNSVKALQKKLRGKLTVVDGVSRISSIATAAGFAGCSYTGVSAYEMTEAAASGLLRGNLVVYDIDDRALASDVKLLLGNAYGEETEITYYIGGVGKKLPIYELDRQTAYDYSSAVAVREIPLLDKTRFTVEDLQKIIVLLRKPDGCPWDRVQTPKTIKMNAVEEAYELVDAIDADDDDKILEETGDILMQAVFHAVMKEEQGAFDWTDVATGVCEKLITRHTHVFGKDGATDASSALNVWEKNKMKEKHQQTYASAVNDVPKVFPALLQAQKVAKRVEKGGWGFADLAEIEAKLKEEYAELKEAYASGDQKSVKEELGDFLLAAAGLAREVGADAEEALLDAVKKLKKRFTAYENAVLADGKDVNALTQEEKEAYYQKIKAALKAE